jgi:HEAT repeats
VRRNAAAIALAKGVNDETRPVVHKLLKDENANLRVRVALALAYAKDKEAVPVLIDALSELTRENFEPAQEALYQIAGDKAPESSPGDDAASRKRHRDAWASWWDANKGSADLGRLTASPTMLGYTLMAQINLNQNMGRVAEYDRAGKVRWFIDGINFPLDARMIGNNRVLIVEYQGLRVTERDLKGTIIWQYQGLGNNPISAQRLPNGHTFIATMAEIIEVDRDRKEYLRYNFSNRGQNLNCAFKIANGEIVCFTQQGQVVRLDSKGKEIKQFPYRAGGSVGSCDASPQGKLLIASNNNMVQAMDLEGKLLFQVNTPNVTSASWLPNGNFLVASYNANNVVEMTSQGRVVAEHRDNYHHFRARRR